MIHRNVNTGFTELPAALLSGWSIAAPNSMMVQEDLMMLDEIPGADQEKMMDASKLNRKDILTGLRDIGVQPGMELEVHCSLKSFGHVDGGAETVLSALKTAVGPEGSLFMPALRLSPDLPKTEADLRMGITYKARILSDEEPRSAMGIVADTFRLQPDVVVSEGVFGTAAWGRNAEKARTERFQHLIDNGGMALMLGVDIYRLTAMHYVEDLLPQRVRDIFKPADAVRAVYPEDQWFVETGHAPVKAWYTIQERAFAAGLIRTGTIGACPVMFFPVGDVVGLYAAALREDPLGLYGLAR